MNGPLSIINGRYLDDVEKKIKNLFNFLAIYCKYDRCRCCGFCTFWWIFQRSIRTPYRHSSFFGFVRRWLDIFGLFTVTGNADGRSRDHRRSNRNVVDDGSGIHSGSFSATPARSFDHDVSTFHNVGLLDCRHPRCFIQLLRS